MLNHERADRKKWQLTVLLLGGAMKTERSYTAATAEDTHTQTLSALQILCSVFYVAMYFSACN